MNAGRFSFDIHKFAPLNRAFISLLHDRSGPFEAHRFAPERCASEQKRECGQVYLRVRSEREHKCVICHRNRDDRGCRTLAAM